MIKPLVIAYPFLHESDACGRIERYFFSRLPGDKFAPTIVCSEPRNLKLSNNRSNKILIPESRVVSGLFKVVNRLRISDCFFQPDYQWTAWGKKVISKIDNEIKEGKYDYIHTINMPCSSHLIGLELKKKYGIPWVAQFYDPWYNNPYRQQHRRTHERDEVYERDVAKNADLILHSNQIMIDDWGRTYGGLVENKIALLPYIVDERARDISTRNDDVLIISHIGNSHIGRQSLVLINAIEKLMLSHPALQNKIRVNFVGDVTDLEKEMIYRKGFNNIFNITGRLEDKDCNIFFAESDAFVAIDTEHSHNIFFPSKLLNYFFYGKPIIGLCQKESVTRMELEASNNFVFDYNDVDGLSSFLASAIKDKTLLEKNNKSYWERFSSKSVIGQYKKLISNLGV